MRAWKVGEQAFWRGSRSAASPMFPEERRLLTDFWVLVTDVDSNSRLPMRVQATDGFAFDPCPDIRCLEPGDVTGAGPTPPRETASFAEAAIAPPGASTPAELQRIQARGGSTYVLRDGNIVQLPDGVPAPSGAVRGVGTSPPEPRIPELAAPTLTPRQAEAGLKAEEAISGPVCQHGLYSSRCEACAPRFLRELAGDGVYLTGPEAAAYRAFRAASAALEDSHRAFRDRQREHLEATAVLGRAATKGNDKSDGGP